VGDARTKASVISPMMNLFDNYASRLSSLEVLDKAYLNDVNIYAMKISTGKACYDNLVSIGTVQPSDPQVAEAYAFYADRQSKIDGTRSILIPELSKIAEAKKLVESTVTLINNSNSTQEIGAIYDDYVYKVDSNKYPTNQTEAARKGEYTKNTNDSKNDITNIDKYQATCTQLGAGNGGNFGGGGGLGM
jgi:hypothetical protein